MKKVVNIPEETHTLLSAYCKCKGIAMGQWLDALILGELNKKDAPTAPTSISPVAPVPVIKVPRESMPLKVGVKV